MDLGTVLDLDSFLLFEGHMGHVYPNLHLELWLS